MHGLVSLGAACLALAHGILASPADLSARHSDLHSRQTVSSCKEPLHLIVGGGNNRAPGTMNANQLLQSLVNDIDGAIPGTTEFLPAYDGTATPGPAATKAYEAAVQQYAASCPDVPIVLLGYSFGGIIMMNTLCGGISPNYNANIIAAVAYGEETRVAGQSYDTGNCTTSAPGKLAPVRANPQACDPYAAKIQSYCLSTDPNCCQTGTDAASHFDYPQYYDQDAFNFIKQKYYERKYNHGGWGGHGGSSGGWNHESTGQWDQDWDRTPHSKWMPEWGMGW